MSLPNSPSDCQAPFSGPVPQYIWPYDESADQAEKSIGSHLALVEPDFRHNYALAQQAEFEYLWLRELYKRTSRLHDAAQMSIGTYGSETTLAFDGALADADDAVDRLTPYLNPL